ncbi:MAG: MBL fold metallo-hydrolase, partial [Candidatus Aenigmatarchaeota archaeon]
TARVMTVDKTLRVGSIINTANFSFGVIPTPGHTPGSICLYDAEKKILISGDTLFETSIGRTDMYGGNQDQLISSLKRLSALSIQYLLPGHGSPKKEGIGFLIKQMLNTLSTNKKI